MSPRGDASVPSRAARAEAAAWLAQLHGPGRNAGMEEDFRAWLRADADHARAFEHATEVWDATANLDLRGLPRLAPRAADGRVRVRQRLALVATVLLAAFGAWMLLLPPRGIEYATGIGEQRSVRLADGTQLSLNASSAVEVDYERDRRNVRLSHGEVLFEVAHDAQRPFVVTVGERTVTALGTSFVVRGEADRLEVTLLEGKVSVARASPAPRAPATAGVPSPAITLQPGQRLRMRADAAPQLDTQGADAAVAWRRGEIILDDTPLEEAVAEMNRYDQHRLSFDDSALGQLRVSGIYRTGNNRDFAHALASVHGLAVKEDGDRIRLARK